MSKPRSTRISNSKPAPVEQRSIRTPRSAPSPALDQPHPGDLLQAAHPGEQLVPVHCRPQRVTTSRASSNSSQQRKEHSLNAAHLLARASIARLPPGPADAVKS